MHVPELIAYLNGRFAPLAELTVPVLDRGFLFGDGVYEMIPVYGRRPFRLAEHLKRLAASLAAVRIDNPHDEATWSALVLELIARQPFGDQSIYLQVTRGAAYPRNHAIPARATPTVLLFADPLNPPATVLVEQGVAAVGMEDPRWQRCDIKTISLLGNVLARAASVDAAAAETVMFRDGLLTEGSASNIFTVKNGLLLTPAPSNRMLTGITYDVVLELARRHGPPPVIRPVTEAEVRSADELWLTSSSKEILAIVSLDGIPIGNGAPGPIYRRMYGHYQQFKAGEMRPGEETP
ncbi:D-amino acid aminotransferase [Chitiniphilus eburneus]|uniref:D-amino acid aminotransferase n=1 Tax=Chitiniphilus eburneus TaxID=2571148 RepID=A0A4U0QAW8_9NEIS|nr:D-amino acid aminotransferase [Chitiniphilus eburneus]TJZ72974.1 D-amino acid aminotransferase [Chitiniphilus eburneus]